MPLDCRQPCLRGLASSQPCNTFRTCHKTAVQHECSAHPQQHDRRRGFHLCAASQCFVQSPCSFVYRVTLSTMTSTARTATSTRTSTASTRTPSMARTPRKSTTTTTARTPSTRTSTARTPRKSTMTTTARTPSTTRTAPSTRTSTARIATATPLSTTRRAASTRTSTARTPMTRTPSKGVWWDSVGHHLSSCQCGQSAVCGCASILAYRLFTVHTWPTSTLAVGASSLACRPTQNRPQHLYVVFGNERKTPHPHSQYSHLSTHTSWPVGTISCLLCIITGTARTSTMTRTPSMPMTTLRTPSTARTPMTRTPSKDSCLVWRELCWVWLCRHGSI